MWRSARNITVLFIVFLFSFLLLISIIPKLKGPTVRYHCANKSCVDGEEVKVNKSILPLFAESVLNLVARTSRPCNESYVEKNYTADKVTKIRWLRQILSIQTTINNYRVAFYGCQTEMFAIRKNIFLKKDLRQAPSFQFACVQKVNKQDTSP